MCLLCFKKQPSDNGKFTVFKINKKAGNNSPTKKAGNNSPTKKADIINDLSIKEDFYKKDISIKLEDTIKEWNICEEDTTNKLSNI